MVYELNVYNELRNLNYKLDVRHFVNYFSYLN
jgi:hypothetical protein